MRDYSKLDKLGRGSYYSADHKHYPMTKTEYVKQGGKWKEASKEDSLISRNQIDMVLADQGLPFERSHRHENRDRYRNNVKWDTFSSISPNGDRKTTWQVDFHKGGDNERRLADKRYYDRQRYLKKKAEKSKESSDKQKNGA